MLIAYFLIFVILTANFDHSIKKSEESPHGLPEDVCEYNKDLNLSYSVKFLSVASSKGRMFKDIKVVKRSSKKRK